MTRPGIEPRSPGRLANTLTARPMSGICTYICRIIHSDTTIKTHEGKRRNEGRKKTSLEKYSPLTLLQGFERVVQSLHVRGCWRPNININMTPLLWPSRCVFLVLLDAQPEVLGSTPSGLFRGPPQSGVAFPTTSGLYCLEVCWQPLWDPNSTQLYNNSTPTRSPTGSLKSNV